MATVNLGRVQLINRGEYDPAYTYVPLDLFTYNDYLYLVNQEATGVTPPNDAYYTSFVPYIGTIADFESTLV